MAGHPVDHPGHGQRFRSGPFGPGNAELHRNIDAARGEQRRQADIEHVAIQGRLLLGEELLGRLSQRLSEEGDQDISGIDALRNALSAVPVPETNLLELRAEGGVPEQLQRVVNRWAESYEEFRAEEIEAARAELRRGLDAWVASYAGGDLHSYLSLYADDFTYRGMDRDRWAAFRTQSITSAPPREIALRGPLQSVVRSSVSSCITSTIRCTTWRSTGTAPRPSCCTA